MKLRHFVLIASLLSPSFIAFAEIVFTDQAAARAGHWRAMPGIVFMDSDELFMATQQPNRNMVRAHYWSKSGNHRKGQTPIYLIQNSPIQYGPIQTDRSIVLQSNMARAHYYRNN